MSPSEIEPLPLLIEESDLRPSARNAIQAFQQGVTVLGGEVGATKPTPTRLILDALPDAVTRKIERIVPDGFAISELQFCFKVEGKVFGSGLTGEVKAIFKPREPSSELSD
jgi:hypothetical protein